MEGERQARGAPAREWGLGRAVSSRQLPLRENYIINRGREYKQLAGEVHKLIHTPKFNRFISLKKHALKDTSHLIDKLSPRPDVRRHLESGFNRRQVFLMRQRRPAHNSPLKRAEAEKQQEQQTRKGKRPLEGLKEGEEAGKVGEEAENAMLIKQLVTHLQPQRGIAAVEDPYSPRSASKYYVAEVVKQHLNPDSLVREHLFSSLYFLQLLAAYALPPNQPPAIPLALPQREKYRDKITVVFDLDETLVHCFEELSEPHEVELSVRFPGGGSMVAPLNVRPGARELLAELAEHFELMVFTASHECYANAVVDHLDPLRSLIQHRLYRHHCLYIEEGYYVKDLRLLGRDLARVVLVDNAAYSYSFQLDNGIPILPYYEGTTDFQLNALRQYLLALTGDVREANRRAFRLADYVRFTEVEQLVAELYL